MLRLEVDAIRGRFEVLLSSLSDKLLLDIDNKTGRSSSSSSSGGSGCGSSNSRYADEVAAKREWDTAVVALDEQFAAEFAACVGGGTAVADTLWGEFSARTAAAKTEQQRHFITRVIAPTVAPSSASSSLPSLPRSFLPSFSLFPPALALPAVLSFLSPNSFLRSLVFSLFPTLPLPRTLLSLP